MSFWPIAIFVLVLNLTNQSRPVIWSFTNVSNPSMNFPDLIVCQLSSGKVAKTRFSVLETTLSWLMSKAPANKKIIAKNTTITAF
jgi:hypothetical protein